MQHAFQGIEDIASQVMARWAAKQAAQADWYAANVKPAAPATVAGLRAELARELIGFDPAYPMSDDHTFYCRQQAKADRMADLTRRIVALERK